MLADDESKKFRLWGPYSRRLILKTRSLSVAVAMATFLAMAILRPITRDLNLQLPTMDSLPIHPAPPPPPPHVCSEEQMRIVKYLFPHNRGTNCPNPTWWDDHMFQVFQQELSSSSPSRGRVGISLGCNKGDDAVDMLAKLSGNREVSTTDFREAFRIVANESTSGLGRACPVNPETPLAKDHPLWQRKSQYQHAQVFCVEAATTTAANLKGARDKMPAWKEDFTVTHAALGSRDGTAYFPRVALGSEIGQLCRPTLDVMGKVVAPDNCEAVDLISVDTYVSKYVEPKVLAAAAASEPASPVIIDILSVDVEGFDWDVLGLGGASSTLKQVKYLEFEYHEVGNWGNYNLSDVTIHLWDNYSMICYYAGKGMLWRLTGCFQDYFNAHTWANVACVSPILDPILAERMEALFQNQIFNVTLPNETLAVA